MSTHYFKATDGHTTVFRASNSRVYKSATFHRWGFSFSTKPAGLDDMEVEEITRSEFQALLAAKVEQIKAAGRDPSRYTTPSDSWIRNSGPRWDVSPDPAKALTRAGRMAQPTVIPEDRGMTTEQFEAHHGRKVEVDDILASWRRQGRG